MADVVFRVNDLLSTNASAVGTAAVQVSGGPKANWPLTGVSASFYPNYHRQILRIVNTSTSATLYVGSNSSITATAGGGWFKQLAPGQFCDFDCNGSVPVWLVASAASTPFTIEEYA